MVNYQWVPKIENDIVKGQNIVIVGVEWYLKHNIINVVGISLILLKTLGMWFIENWKLTISWGVYWYSPSLKVLSISFYFCWYPIPKPFYDKHAKNACKFLFIKKHCFSLLFLAWWQLCSLIIHLIGGKSKRREEIHLIGI